MGDVLRTTAILKPLKEKYDHCIIHWLVKKESVPFLKDKSEITQILTEEETIPGTFQDYYDLIINLDDDEYACAITSSLKSSRIIGAHMHNNKRVYSDDAAPWFDMGLISQYGKSEADKRKKQNKKTYQQIIFEILDLPDYKDHLPTLTLPAPEVMKAREWAHKNAIMPDDTVVAINTGAGSRWQDKKLSIVQTVQLIDQLSEDQKIKIVLCGGPQEKDRNNQIIKHAQAKIIDAGTENSLLEFAAILNMCTHVITSDSLALHIAVALQKKIIAFFYPTSAAEIELYNNGKKIIAQGNSYCSYQQKCDDPPVWNITEIVQSLKELL